MKRPKTHWTDKCPECGMSLVNEMTERIIDGNEFDVTCFECEHTWHVDVHMVPEFCLSDAAEVREYEKERSRRIRMEVDELKESNE